MDWFTGLPVAVQCTLIAAVAVVLVAIIAFDS